MLSDRTQVYGVVYFTGGVFAFTLIYTIQKSLILTYTWDVVLIYRFGAAAIIALPVMIVIRKSFFPRHTDVVPLVIVSVCSVLTILTAIITLMYLPLGRATILFGIAPVIVVLIAPLFLREKVGLIHWATIVVGFVGVSLVTADGGFGYVSVYDLWALASASSYALVILSTRRLAFTTSSLKSSVHVNLLILLLLSPLATFRWVTPTTYDLVPILLLGLLTWVAELLTLLGLSRLHVTIAAPLDYLSIVFALLIGYLVWSEVPVVVALIGACMITAAGIVALRLLDPSDVPGEHEQPT
jgi:drug/metabolite transporter (DMT)-like permease